MEKYHIEGNFSRDLKKWRLIKGYTQQDLADSVGVRRETVVKWEDKDQPNKWPKKANCLKLSDILNVNVTTKGIIENHITDMKANKHETEGFPQSLDEWYKKTIDSLIQQHESIIDKYTERTDKQIDSLERDKLNLWELVRGNGKAAQETKQ